MWPLAPRESAATEGFGPPQFFLVEIGGGSLRLGIWGWGFGAFREVDEGRW